MNSIRTRPRAAVLGACLALALLGVTAGALASTALGSKSTPQATRTMTGMKMTTTTGNGMGGMPMAVPIQPLGTTVWQGMKIQARLGGAVPFMLFEGTTSRIVKPAKKENVHLMVMLSDAQTGMSIPYGTVWATIREHGKIVFDERLWPMISRYMGTHFGNNVALPGTGTYQLSLLVGPPQAARHMEYSKVWLHPHRVNLTFHWKKPK